MEEKWIPVKWHKDIDKETGEWKFVFDCEMPEDDEDIFITVRGKTYAMLVTCTIEGSENDGRMYRTWQGWDWFYDITAWMPIEIPEPYKEE